MKNPKFIISKDLEIPKKVLLQFTDNAVKLGLRYQTLAGSILHQDANNITPGVTAW